MRTRVIAFVVNHKHIVLKVAVQSPPDLYRGSYRPWLVMEFMGILNNKKRHRWTRNKIMRTYRFQRRLYEACCNFYGRDGRFIELPEEHELTWTDVYRLTVMTDVQRFLPQFYSWHDYTSE